MSKDRIQQIPLKDISRSILEGDQINVPTSIISNEGLPVSLDFSILPGISGPTSRRWVCITALADGKPIGILDAKYIPDTRTMVVEYPCRKNPVTLPPYTEIRTQAGDDGLFVEEPERGKGIGAELFSTAKSIARGLGVDGLLVTNAKPNAEKFYNQQGGVKVSNGFWYEV